MKPFRITYRMEVTIDAFDEEQAQEFIREMAVMDLKSTIFDEIKKSNPELLI